MRAVLAAQVPGGRSAKPGSGSRGAGGVTRSQRSILTGVSGLPCPPARPRVVRVCIRVRVSAPPPPPRECYAPDCVLDVSPVGGDFDKFGGWALFCWVSVF